MDVVYKEGDRSDRVRVDVLSLALSLLSQLLVELDEQKRLVLHVGEQIVLAYEVEHIRAT